jgi:hypothetical protein
VTCEPQFSGGRYHYHRQNSKNEDSDRERTEFSPNILAVSKTIHAEAASFLYTQRIVVADTYALLTFLNQIGPQNASMLRELTIQGWCSSRSHKSINYPAMSLLAIATNLEKLNIACSVGYFRYYGGWRYSRGKTTECAVRVARKVYRDCHPWLEAVGRTRGDITAGIGMIAIDEEQNFEGKGHGVGMDVQMDLFAKELRRLLKA